MFGCKIAIVNLLFYEGNNLKKIKIYSEIVYAIALLGLTFAVALLAAADFGVSVIVAPAYIMSQAFTAFTFGQWSYIIQGALFIVFCIAMKKFKAIYLFSFLTCVVYGTILDLWREIIPIFNTDITAPGSMNVGLRITMFVVGELITGLTVMLFFKSYLYPQVCDLFVKGIAQRYGINQAKFKRIYDLCCLVISIALSLTFFKSFVAVKWGTVVIALATGLLIGIFSKIYDKFFETVPCFPKFEKLFIL